MSSIIYPVLIFASTIFTISSIQWIAMKFIVNFCYDDSLWGLFTNMFTLGSPICLFVNNIQIMLTNHYIIVWTGAAAAVITYILKK